nr:phage protein [Bacteriovorax sp. HI3]
MASKVDICNEALSILGQKEIVSLSDESVEAYACNRHIDTVIKVILAGHPWNCVSEDFNLNRLSDSPVSEYKYYYQLPTGYLRLNSVSPEQEYKIQGKKLLSNAESVQINCVVFNDNTDIYTPELSSGIAHALAARLAYPMTSSVSMAERVQGLADDLISMAKSSNSFEGTKRDNVKKTWISAKLGGY